MNHKNFDRTIQNFHADCKFCGHFLNHLATNSKREEPSCQENVSESQQVKVMVRGLRSDRI